MRYEEFIAEVRNLAELDDNGRAVEACRATLETLKERLAGNEPSNLAAQLPEELAGYVRGEGGQDNFSLEEFYNRVAEKEDIGVNEATVHARAVATVLQAAVTTGEVDSVRAQLKPEYEALFGQPGALPRTSQPVEMSGSPQVVFAGFAGRAFFYARTQTAVSTPREPVSITTPRVTLRKPSLERRFTSAVPSIFPKKEAGMRAAAIQKCEGCAMPRASSVVSATMLRKKK